MAPPRPRLPDRRRLGRFALGYGAALLGGSAFFLLGTPLPWMLGALTAVAAASLAGAPVDASRTLRNLGALVLGCALGLYFTPQAAARILADWPLILLAALSTLAVGLALAPLLAHLARTDRRSAFFASMPGGVAEMALLAESYGAKPAFVAVLQLLRIVGVVVLVPAAIALLGGISRVPSERALLPWNLPGLLLLIALGGVGTFVLTKLRIRNTWVLGGLAVGVGFTTMGVTLSGVPPWLVATAQVVMGAQLGTQFERATFVGGRRLLSVAALHVALLTGGCSLIGLAIAWATGASPATMVLATAPGGIAEMSVTAKTMALDVAVVVAFHLVRIAVTAVLVQPVSWLWRKWGWM